MSYTRTLVDKYAAKHGVAVDDLVELVSTYIDNQGSDDALKDFLADHEDGDEDTADPSAFLDALCEYVDDQQSDEAFEDFLVGESIDRKFEEDAAIAAKRTGSPHEEFVVGDRTICGVCGPIEEADPNDTVVLEWHGDSFEDVPEGEEPVAETTAAVSA